jgi:organic radical activating enzyme
MKSILGRHVVIIFVTYQCNRKCVHCSSTAYSGDNDLGQDIDEIERCIADPWTHQINLMGGEPTLYLDRCEELYKLCKKHNKKTLLCTNGTWIYDEEKTKRIYDMDIDLILVSINEYSKSDCFDIANRVCDKFLDHPKSTIVGMTVFDSTKVGLLEQAFYVDHGMPQYNEAYWTEWDDKLKYKFAKIQNPLLKMGAAANWDELLFPRVKYSGPMTCNEVCVVIHAGNKLYADCGAAGNGCYLGTISDFGDQPISEFHNNKKTIVFNCHDFPLTTVFDCCKREFHCYDGQKQTIYVER